MFTKSPIAHGEVPRLDYAGMFGERDGYIFPRLSKCNFEALPGRRGIQGAFLTPFFNFSFNCGVCPVSIVKLNEL